MIFTENKKDEEIKELKFKIVEYKIKDKDYIRVLKSSNLHHLLNILFNNKIKVMLNGVVVNKSYIINYQRINKSIYNLKNCQVAYKVGDVDDFKIEDEHGNHNKVKVESFADYYHCEDMRGNVSIKNASVDIYYFNVDNKGILDIKSIYEVPEDKLKVFIEMTLISIINNSSIEDINKSKNLKELLDYNLINKRG